MKIILLNGPPRCGKDTAAAFIERKLLNVAHYKLSKPLKEGVRTMLGMTYSDMMYLEEKKDTATDALGGMTYRQLQIDFFKFMQERFGEAILGKIALRSMDNLIFTTCVISDTGRHQEVIPLINKFGKNSIGLIELTRPGCDFDGDIRNYIQSELQIGHYARVDNEFDLEMFELQIERVLKLWNLSLRST